MKLTLKNLCPKGYRTTCQDIVMEIRRLPGLDNKDIPLPSIDDAKALVRAAKERNRSAAKELIILVAYAPENEESSDVTNVIERGLMECHWLYEQIIILPKQGKTSAPRRDALRTIFPVHRIPRSRKKR